MEDFLISSLGYESDDSGSEVDNSEIQPILSDRGNISLLQEKIDKNIRRAVVLLGRIAVAFIAVSVLETVSVLLVLDCLLLYSTYLSHAYTISWEVVFSPLIGLSLLWLIVFLYIAVCHAISYYHLKAIQIECLFLYILGTIGYTTTLILLIKYLNSSDEILLKYFTADLLVSSVSFLMALTMDVSFNLAIYSDRFGHSRPKILKQAPEGGWTLDGSRNCRHFTFLGDIDMHAAVSASSSSSSSSSVEDESSALLYCCRRMKQLCCCAWRRAAQQPSHGAGIDTSTASPLQFAEEASYSPRSDFHRRNSDTTIKINKKGRNNVNGFNSTHWIGDYSSDESPSPSSKTSNSMEGPGSRGSSNGPILL
eukprot:gene23410-31752_t